MERKIFGYLRISTNLKKQKTDRQKITLLEYAVANNFTIDEFFTDIITGGTKAENRDDFLRMKSKLRSGDIIVVTDIDRMLYKSNLDDGVHDISRCRVVQYAKGGVVQVNPNDLLAGLAKKHGEDGFAMVQNGERILTQHQTATFDHFVELLNGMKISPQMFTPDFTKAAQAITTNNAPAYSVSIGDIHLHDVQNTKDFGAALMKYIPGEFGRQLCGRTR